MLDAGEAVTGQPQPQEQQQQQQQKQQKAPSERQQQISKLMSTYRGDIKKLQKQVSRKQNAWHQQADALPRLTAVPGSHLPPPARPLPVRKRVDWRPAEREALRRWFLAYGVGRWKEIHSALIESVRSLGHGVGDVEDACWEVLADIWGALSEEGAADESALIEQLLSLRDTPAPGPTPGAPLEPMGDAAARSAAKRLRLLAELSHLMGHLLACGGEAVAGRLRAVLEAAPPKLCPPPAPWWGVDADLALLVGVWRHGYGAYGAIRADPELAHAFQAAGDPVGGVWGDLDAVAWPDPRRLSIDHHTPAPTPAPLSSPAPPAALPPGGAGAGGGDSVGGSGWPAPDALGRRLRWLMDVLSDAVAAAGGAEGIALTPLPPPRAPGPKPGADGAASDAGGGGANAAAMAAQGSFGYKEDDFVWAWGNEMDQELDGLFGDEAGAADGAGGGRGAEGKGKVKGAGPGAAGGGAGGAAGGGEQAGPCPGP
ncbi:hypothetical protein MNEG_9811 [Monoraphidium neglectum]|uniref:Uncharacterized protein n=1 Tax=Monoraphidium neglectum TaxID=145388 RepID=A0A0D2MUY8_9CHLO|nr:hypothetical protein MNEG_9811 [Monoraphidium neglectum]KIY98150.1 hypothetical protein MNEG_9811 [Monoraphidium neglectum]|eukprot:XP_013897170.1 hypothetical protein MNEG_9811 [Monoraphidium neglectum]